jgi:anti-sigma regulatory factor (Ser/Thr protein kinase)
MGRRHVEPPRTIDLVIDQPHGALSATTLRGIRHDVRQAQHVHGMFLRAVQLRAAGTALENDVNDLVQAARALQDRQDAALLAIGAAVDAPVARCASLSVASMLDAAVHPLRAIARDAGIELRVARTRLWSYTDGEMVGRIVGNLVANAIVHAGAKRVLVGARRRAGRLTLHVLDDGCGMADDELALLCQPGFRGREAAVGGLGLGLYNVQLLAQALGGRVRIASQQGRGTEVRVRTASYCGPAQEAAVRGLRRDGQLAGRRILVVSRDPVVRQTLARALGDRGATVADFGDVVAPALELPFWKLAPDGFVLDGATAADEAFVQGLHLRFGALRGVQLVPDEAAEAPLLALEVLRLKHPLDDAACARLVAWFA